VNSLLFNSLLTAISAMLLSTAFGLAAALTLIALPGLLRRVAIAVCVLALALPPFLVTNCWLHYLGNTGVWRAWLPLNIFSAGGAIWILSLMLWPIPLVASLSAWRALDAAHFDAEPELRGWQLLRWLLWPAARNAVSCAAILTFVIALNQFSVPAILQVKVLPVEAWIQFSSALSPARALAVSWPLIAIPIVALVLFRRINIQWNVETIPPASHAVRRQLGLPWFAAAATVTALLLLISVALPLFQLFGAPRTWTELSGVWQASWPLALNSAIFAAGAALLALLIALLTWRTRLGWGLWALFLLPGMLLSIALIWALNRPVLEILYRSFAVVTVALTLRYSGPVWALVRQGFRGRDPALMDAAQLDGLSPWGVLRHVYWPRAAATVFGAAYASYVLCLWDVETIMVLYPPGAETIALRVFNLLHYGHVAQVNGLCVILLAVAAAPGCLYALCAAFSRRASV
jgi:iron(III) transport system permease protein